MEGMNKKNSESQLSCEPKGHMICRRTFLGDTKETPKEQYEWLLVVLTWRSGVVIPGLKLYF